MDSISEGSSLGNRPPKGAAAKIEVGREVVKEVGAAYAHTQRRCNKVENSS